MRINTQKDAGIRANTCYNNIGKQKKSGFPSNKEGDNTMAKYAYPAIFAKEEGGYSIRFPDFASCYTAAETIEEGLEMAQDALCLTIYDLEEDGKVIPDPTPVQEVRTDGDEFATLVACDTIQYRKFFDNKAVKKTLAIPSWLNTLAEKAEVNFSVTLQNALKKN